MCNFCLTGNRSLCNVPLFGGKFWVIFLSGSHCAMGSRWYVRNQVPTRLQCQWERQVNHSNDYLRELKRSHCALQTLFYLCEKADSLGTNIIQQRFLKCSNRAWTGRPGVLRFMGSQRVGHDWATELTELNRAWSVWVDKKPETELCPGRSLRNCWQADSLSNVGRKGAGCRLTGAWLITRYQLYLPRKVTCGCYVLCSLSIWILKSHKSFLSRFLKIFLN